MVHVTDPSAEKQRLRRTIRASRDARTTQERRAAADAIAEHGGYLLRGLSGQMPLLVAAYLSTDSEPGTDSLIARAHDDNDAVWVPRVTGDGLEWAAYRRTTEVTPGPFGIREPAGPAVRPDDLVGLDVMFVPGMAVDERGHRLGHGGGFYDRVLSTFPRNNEGGPLIVIVLYDDEILTHVPTEEHDCCVDVALTPAGLIDLG